MANGALLNKNVSPDAFKGYVVRTLEDIQIANTKQDKKIDTVVTSIHELQKTIKQYNGISKNVHRIETSLYGTDSLKDCGLICDHEKLKISHSIKSGWYGLLGGGGFAALLTLVYFIFRGKV